MIEVIKTANAPPPSPVYSQAVKANGFIFCSGSVPMTPDCKLTEGSITDKTHQTFACIIGVLEAAGSSLKKIVKMNIYLADINSIVEFNKVYATYFPDYKPARTCVAVAGLPMGVDLEMECVALE